MDLLFSPIDKFIAENFPEPGSEGKAQEVIDSAESSKSNDSRESVPALTGNTHITMERDFFERKYELE